MMRFANGVLAASLMVLAGCTTAPAPVTLVRTVEVSVPVPVPCVRALPIEPAFRTDAQLRAMGNYQLVNSLLADRLARKMYIDDLRAQLIGCLQPDPPRGDLPHLFTQTAGQAPVL